MKKIISKKNGFTLIELLIVIAIIAILAVVVFVALNPLKRFRDSRDAVRVQDVRNLIDAIKVHQVDNNGNYLYEIASTTINLDTWYMIVDGNGGSAMTSGCDDQYDASLCDVEITGDDHCVDLDKLVSQGYIGEIPISPTGAVTWDDGSTDGEEGTGYAFKHNSNGTISVQACDPEDIGTILLTK